MRSLFNIQGIAVAAAVMLGAASCSTITNTADTTAVHNEIVSLTVADVTVAEQKATATAEWKWNPFSAVNLEREKKNVTARLLKEHDADVLVEPNYEVHRRGLFRGGSLTVTGYPGRYSNFHAMTPAEAEVVNAIKFPHIYNSSAAPVGIRSRVEEKANAATPLFERKEGVLNPQSFWDFYCGIVFWNCGYDVGEEVGVMYGHMGHSGWGWYAKAGFLAAIYDDYYDDYHYGSYLQETSRGTVSVTGGVMRGFTNCFSVYAGVGIGGALYLDEDYNYNRIEADKFAIPVEIGTRFNFGHFNALVGMKFNLGSGFADGDINYIPTIGVGYTF